MPVSAILSTVGDTREFKRLLKQYETIDLTDVAEIMKARMIHVIDANRKREVKQSYNRFERKFTKHISDVLEVDAVLTKNKGFGVGIGNIEKLNKEVPYWLVVNNGGYIPGPVHGYFTGGNPQGGAGGDSDFAYNKKGPLMTPHTPIRPMNYIEKTIQWANTHILKYVDASIKKQLWARSSYKK
jgi:hypothetical protein